MKIAFHWSIYGSCGKQNFCIKAIKVFSVKKYQNNLNILHKSRHTSWNVNPDQDFTDIPNLIESSA